MNDFVGFEPVPLVAGLAVAPRYRRHGIALRLLEELLESCAVRGSSSAICSIINARNRASIALHQQVGFTIVDRGPAFAGVTFEGGEGLLLSRTAR